MRIRIDSLAKSFGRSRVLDGLSVDFASGELIALVGPSGSGKTTLLRLLAGLETPDRGRIHFGKRDVTDLDPGLRKVGLVFQHYALFRHMRVSANVSFGLRARPRSTRPPRAEMDRRVEEILSLVQLEGLGSRYPSELSGGQRQRVGLARALASEPDVLLLDEPFGALDTPVRKELRRWLRALHEDRPMTTVLVTHDREEALEVADRVVVLEGGRIRQAGTPIEVYHHPADAFVCAFLGEANVFEARVRGGLLQLGDDDGAAPVPLSRPVTDGPVAAYVRPHDISLRPAAFREIPPFGLPAVVERSLPAGPAVRVSLRRTDTGEAFQAEIPHGPMGSWIPAPGDKVTAGLRIAHAFPPAGPHAEIDSHPATKGSIMSKAKSLLSLALAALAASSALHAAPPAPAAAGEPKTALSIGYLPITDHLTVIAKAQTEFKRADLKLVKFGSWPELAEALKVGAVDGAFVLSPIALNLKLKGAPLKAVLLGHRNGSVITVKADGPVHKASDLRGRTIAIPSRFSTHNILLNRLLAAEKIDPAKDVKIIELSPPEMVSSLATGRIDAYIVAEPFGGQAELQKVGRVLALSKDIWPDHICCVLNLRQQLIDQSPEAVQEIVNAFVHSAHSITVDPAGAADLSKQFLGQKPEVIRHVLTTPKGRVTYEDLSPRAADFEATQDALVSLGIFKEKVDLVGYLDDSFAKKAYGVKTSP